MPGLSTNAQLLDNDMQRAEKSWHTGYSDSTRHNLSGLSTAIETVFPKTEQQLCAIHQIRNSTKYVAYKDIKQVMFDLKLVYCALTFDDAEYHLEKFREKWDKKYPQII